MGYSINFFVIQRKMKNIRNLMRRRLTTVMIKNYEFKKLFNEEPSDDEAEIKNKKRKMEIGINKT